MTDYAWRSEEGRGHCHVFCLGNWVNGASFLGDKDEN